MIWTLNLFSSPSRLSSIDSPHIPTTVFPSHSSIHHSADRSAHLPSSSFCSIAAPCRLAQNADISGLKASSFLSLSYLSHDPNTLFTVINGKNLQVPSDRIPAGIYVSIDVDWRRRWKSTIGVLSADESVAWGNTVTL
jgi:hypothetical protein